MFELEGALVTRNYRPVFFEIVTNGFDNFDFRGPSAAAESQNCEIDDAATKREFHMSISIVHC